MPPLLSAGLRFLASGAVLYIWLWFHGGRPRLRIGRRELLAAFVVGVLLFPGGNGLVTLAEKEAPSGLSSLIIAAIPLWVIVFRLLVRDRVPLVTLAGVAAGFVGVGILVAPGSHAAGIALWSLLTLVAASFCWALGSFVSPRVPHPRDLLLAAAAQQVLGGLVLLVIGFAAGETLDVGQWSGRSLGGTARRASNFPEGASRSYTMPGSSAGGSCVHTIPGWMKSGLGLNNRMGCSGRGDSR